MRTFPAVTLATLGWVEAFAALNRHEQRTTLYKEALQRSGDTGKPLLVVGDPDAGAHTSLARAYDCGDVCVDLEGCPTCQVSVAADITKPLPFEDGSHVVFVSCVFEYVTDFEAAWKEVLRVAGKPQDVFVATVQPWTFTAALYPGANWQLERQGNRYVADEVSSARKVGSLALIGAMVVWMLWPEK